MRSSPDSVARPVLAFALLALLAIALVAGSGLFVIRRLADEQALNEGQQLTVQAARIVERRVDDGLLTGDAESLGAVASIVFDSILYDPVVRVKIWSADGEIVYSDEPKLIGRTYQLDDEEREVLADGTVVSELSDLQAPENSFERSFGQLVEVYTRIRTPGGYAAVVRDLPATVEHRRQRTRARRHVRAGADRHIDRPRGAADPARLGARAPRPADSE